MTGTDISLSNGLTAPTALDYGCSLSKGSVVTVTLGNFTQVPAGGDCSNPFFTRPAITISPSKPDCPGSCSSTFGSAYIGGSQDEIYNADPLRPISFAPGDYVFCSFQTNGPVTANPRWGGGAVRIYIDSPGSSRCSGFASHSGSLPAGFETQPGSFIATQGVGNALSALHPGQLQIYVAGDGTNGDTAVTMTESGLALGQAGFVYAPSSNITVSASAVGGLGGTLAGAYVGYDVNAKATAIADDIGLTNYSVSGVHAPFYVKQYIECTPSALPSPDPTAGC
jgi:hypothetical protein